MEIHWNILDNKRQAILPCLKNLSGAGFYLAGGTALALMLGHRDSRDFDFFKEGDFDTQDFGKKLESAFKGHKVSRSLSKNTVHCKIDDTIELSFITFNYKMMNPLIKTEYFDMASLEDIGCMKLISMSQRTVERDYVDLFFILQKIPLKRLIQLCHEKYPIFNESSILRGLPYIDDVERQEINYKGEKKISLEEISKYFGKLTKEYIRQRQLEEIRRGEEIASIRKNKIEKDRDMER